MLTPSRWTAAGPKEIVSQFTRMAVVWTWAHGALLRAFLVHAMTHVAYDLLDQTAELDNTVADHLTRLPVTSSGGVHTRRPGAGHPTRHPSGVRHAQEPIHLRMGRPPRRNRRPATGRELASIFLRYLWERQCLVAGPLAAQVTRVHTTRHHQSLHHDLVPDVVSGRGHV